MSRYIDAKKANERINKLYPKESCVATTIANTFIDACQTIILDMYDNDAIEVVHCKECIYYKEKGYDSHPYCYYFDEPWSPSRGISRVPDDFCSRGERKEVNKNEQTQAD